MVIEKEQDRGRDGFDFKKFWFCILLYYML